MIRERVIAALDEATVVRLAQDLIRADTTNPPGRELSLARRLQAWAEGAGLETALYPMDEDRGSLLVRLRGSGERAPVAFAGHLDTVPVIRADWTHDPHAGIVVEGMVYGRGASDMKGGLASALSAAAVLARHRVPLKGDLLIACTADEEVACRGAQDLLRRGVLQGIAHLIIPEPTDLEVWVAEKGALWLEVRSQGRAAHGSAPHLGVNAVLPLARLACVLADLPLPHPRHPLLGSPTISVNLIEGGTKVNVVPAEARLQVDIRLLPGQDLGEVRREVERRAREAAGPQVSVETLVAWEAVETPPEAETVQIVRRSVEAILGQLPRLGGAAYFTEGGVYAPGLQVPMVICGPGDPTQAHQTNESVRGERLLQGARAFALMALDMLT
ncbi:MAG: M20 family metallopeptidase [Candidatus Methylomirabilales bacterium]